MNSKEPRSFVKELSIQATESLALAVGDFVNTKITEGGFADLIPLGSGAWDLRELLRTAKKKGWPIVHIVGEALEEVTSGKEISRIDALCRDIKPLLDDKRWEVSHQNWDTVMARTDCLAARILRRYLDKLSPEIREEIEVELVVYDL